MGYLTLDLECDGCLADLQFTQHKQVLTVKTCSCKSDTINKLQDKIEVYERISEKQDKEIIRLEEIISGISFAI